MKKVTKWDVRLKPCQAIKLSETVTLVNKSATLPAKLQVITEILGENADKSGEKTNEKPKI